MVSLEAGDVRVEISPERGALVTALRVGGREVLYLDPATLADPTKNVRGGIPLLFPFAGKLADDTLKLTGTVMKQHGFARDRAWGVTEQDGAAIRMTLAADDQTRARYPFEFVAHHDVMIVPGGVQLALTIVAGDKDLPVSPGWHPYFAVALDDKVKIPGMGDDREYDFGIVAPIDGRSRFATPAVRIEASPELRHLQFWTQPGKPFACIEPFFGPAGTINTEERGWVPAGQARTFWIRIRTI